MLRRMTMTEIKHTPLAKWMFATGTTGRMLAAATGVSESTISRLRTGADVGVDESVIEAVKAYTGLKRL